MKELIVCMCLVCINVCAIQSRTWIVDKHGAGQFTSISNAINVAKANVDLAKADTVKVYPGKYEEKVFLNKDIVVQGSGAEATLISYQQRDFAVEVSGGKLMWFRISSQGPGCKVTGGIITNCVASDCSRAGFDCYTDGSIAHCVSINNADGFYIARANHPIITNCIAYSNREGGFINQDLSYRVEYCTAFANGRNFSLRLKSTGCIEEDPKFESGSYNIASSSPCVNTGNPAYTDPDGTPADMGYYGGDDAPTFPLVRDARIILNSDGTINLEATGVSAY